MVRPDDNDYWTVPAGPGGPPAYRGPVDPRPLAVFAVDNLNELPDVAAKIGIELRNQYLIGYSPTNAERNGKYRKVQVKLVQPRGLPPLKAFWRLGYYAPTQ